MFTFFLYVLLFFNWQSSASIELFSGTISISSQMTKCRIILLLQPITKLYLFTIELILRDDFRCFRSKMCCRTEQPYTHDFQKKASAQLYIMTHCWLSYHYRNDTCLIARYPCETLMRRQANKSTQGDRLIGYDRLTYLTMYSGPRKSEAVVCRWLVNWLT